MGGTRPDAEPLVPRELLFISCFFIAIIVSLLAVTWASVNTLSGVRAYVTGEGLYSKAQKDAVYHLLRYSVTRDETDYRWYEAEISVPRGDARARGTLEQMDGSTAEAEQGFLEGRNDPRDVRAMVAMFRRAPWLDEMERAIRIWREGDAEIARLDDTARALHTEIRRETPDPARVGELLAAVDTANTRLTELEDAFSSTLGAGARRVRALALPTSFAASAALLTIAILSTARLLRRARQSDKLFRSIIENAGDVITILQPDGRLVYGTPALERVLGYRSEDLVGRSAFALIHPDDRPSVEAALRRIASEPGHTESVEFRFQHADGTWRTLAGIGGVLSRGGDTTAIILSSQDVTDRRILEEHLLESQKMDSIGRLAGGVAHDFNNVLTVILSCAGAALEDLPPDSEAAQRSRRRWIPRDEQRASRISSFPSHDGR